VIECLVSGRPFVLWVLELKNLETNTISSAEKCYLYLLEPTAVYLILSALCQTESVDAGDPNWSILTLENDSVRILLDTGFLVGTNLAKSKSSRVPFYCFLQIGNRDGNMVQIQVVSRLVAGGLYCDLSINNSI